eukprot:750676-Hanusia_phi.AAC.3
MRPRPWQRRHQRVCAFARGICMLDHRDVGAGGCSHTPSELVSLEGLLPELTPSRSNLAHGNNQLEKNVRELAIPEHFPVLHAHPVYPTAFLAVLAGLLAVAYSSDWSPSL